MDKLYYRLFVLSLHYFVVFAQCDITSSGYEMRFISSICPQHNNYHCNNLYLRNTQAIFFTCFNINIIEIHKAIQNRNNPEERYYIFLKNSSIPTLSPTGYSWSNVQALQIEETNTNEIIPGFFNKFDYLKELHIIKNKITKLTSGEFSSLLPLGVLNLTENLIETVAPKSFSGLLNLAILDLSTNKITNLPENIFEYQNDLFYVDVSNNMLKNIDGAVFNTLSLKTLNISYNYLSHFNFNQFKNLTKLEYLRFDHNVLPSLPIDAFYNLNHLKHLDLSFNRIKQIPFGLFNDFSELTDLDLSSNNMVLDFHTLSTLKSLKVLKFTNNTVENFDVDTVSTRFKYLESVTLLIDQSWNCNELATAIHKLQFNNISVIRGQSTNGSNVLGISCGNSFFQRNPSLLPEVRVNENATSALFFKLMQNLNSYAANTSNSLTNLQAYMKKIIDNDNAKPSSLVPWQNISLPLNEISNNRQQIFRINSNVGSSDHQVLINLTDSFNEISNNLKRVLSSNSVPVDKTIESEALISEKHEKTKASDNGLILTNILLATILCCLILFAYRNFLKAKLTGSSAQEQVQLM